MRRRSGSLTWVPNLDATAPLPSVSYVAPETPPPSPPPSPTPSAPVAIGLGTAIGLDEARARLERGEKEHRRASRAAIISCTAAHVVAMAVFISMTFIGAAVFQSCEQLNEYNLGVSKIESINDVKDDVSYPLLTLC